MLCVLLLWICVSTAGAAQAIHPLAPPDTSSPRATLKTFLDNMNNAVSAYKAGHKNEAIAFDGRAARCLNLEKEPPALRHVLGFYATLYLKETLDRIEIPSDDEIPDAKTVRTEKISSWTIPYTEITISLVKEDSSVERFLFSNATVRNAEKYYNEVKNLPYTPQSGRGALLGELSTSRSLIIPKAFIDRLPNWMRIEVYGQDAWQWIGLIFYFCFATGAVLLLYRGGRRAFDILDKRFLLSLKHNVGGLILPITLILFSNVGLWFMVYGLHFLNADIYLPIAFVFVLISYGGWIWLIGAAFNRLSAAFVYFGGFAKGGMDDQLVRLAFQAVSAIIIGVMIINLGARLGLPTYSLITGLGIGGIAAALS
jgi:MscS family membrane protein